jgi:hypothetical protein
VRGSGRNSLGLLGDAVEKGFSVPERRRIFHERLPVENIDSSILHLGFYYCPSWTIHRSLIDFFNSIGQSRPSRLARKATYDRSCPKADIRRAALRFIVEVEVAEQLLPPRIVLS